MSPSRDKRPATNNSTSEKSAKKQSTSEETSCQNESSVSYVSHTNNEADSDIYEGDQFHDVENCVIPHICRDAKPLNPAYRVSLMDLINDEEVRMDLEGKYFIGVVVHIEKRGKGDNLASNENENFDRMMVISDVYDEFHGRCCAIFFKNVFEMEEALRWFKEWSLIVKGSLVAVKAPDFRNTFFGQSEDMAIIENVQRKNIVPLNDEKMRYIWDNHGDKLPIRTNVSFASTRRFVYKKVYVKMRLVTIVYSCSGVMCDRAKLEIGRSCFCTNIFSSPRHVLRCQVTLFDKPTCKLVNKIYNCNDFQSLRFSELIVGNVRNKTDSQIIERTGLQITRRVNDYLRKINERGGFIAIGWYKLGSTSDSSGTTTVAGAGLKTEDESTNIIADHDVHPHLVRLIPNLKKEELPAL